MTVETDVAAGTTEPIVPNPDNGYSAAVPDTATGQPTEYTSASMDLTDTDNTYEIIPSATDQNTGEYSSELGGETGDGAYSANSNETSDIDTGVDTGSAPAYETAPSVPTSSPVGDLTQESTVPNEDSTSDIVTDDIPPPPSGYNFETLSPYSNTSLDAPSVPREPPL
ncbi:hypothetical protein H4R20_004025 [Coemansia guatemalensis]|uniref:Uncharacterized protein n=1 Tax=Coemansia guatemalensis TaxID=2761395 RepID=A0A9W8LT58_9FUNG|nr:hypothetical protein H4R20_004025 [Coemansia guatemalensis]